MAGTGSARQHVKQEVDSEEITLTPPECKFDDKASYPFLSALCVGVGVESEFAVAMPVAHYQLVHSTHFGGLAQA